jgi:septum site-determining protein MinC
VNNTVIIKGNKHGIGVVLDKHASFEEIKQEIKNKFQTSSKFFGNANMAVSFEGRELLPEEEIELVDVIEESSELHIICIIDNDEEKDKRYENAMNEKNNDKSGNEGQFYKGTLRSGQVLESESSIVILGDVNPGGRVIAKGNVVILGSLRGNVYAGANGNQQAFVVALEMNPMQIKIGDIIARSSDSAPVSKVKVIQPKIAYVDSENIYIEDLDQEVLDDIQLN